ncbi:hypothetical protein R8Z50_11660 [Longispora sp. K20-0274]
MTEIDIWTWVRAVSGGVPPQTAPINRSAKTTRRALSNKYPSTARCRWARVDGG